MKAHHMNIIRMMPRSRDSWSNKMMSHHYMNRLMSRPRLGDDALKYILICYVEKSKMRKDTNDAIIVRFEAMKKCRKPF